MRKPIIAGNWKLHKTTAESVELVRSLLKETTEAKDVEIVVAPVFTSLGNVADAIAGSDIRLAAQNCYPEKSGAFTGEVSPFLLKDIGCSYVIVGHSERRQIFKEDDAFINKKVKAVLAEGLTAILCIGETLQEREAQRMFDVLSVQVKVGLDGLSAAEMENVVIAYEPVWAIGTGKTATNEQAQEAHAFIRGLLTEMFDEDVSQKVRILYGGSVKPDNVDGLMTQPDVDGALVGGASLKASDFARIVSFKHP